MKKILICLSVVLSSAGAFASECKIQLKRTFFGQPYYQVYKVNKDGYCCLGGCADTLEPLVYEYSIEDLDERIKILQSYGECQTVEHLDWK